MLGPASLTPGSLLVFILKNKMDDQVDSEIEDMGMVKEKIINVTQPLGVVVVNQICQSVEKVFSSSNFYTIPSPSKDVCEV